MGPMMMIVLAVLLVAAAWAVMLYNGLVQVKHNVEGAGGRRRRMKHAERIACCGRRTA
jgi:hypothetical protein